MPGQHGTVAWRFWNKVDRSGAGGHWLWTGYVNPKGYAYFQTLPLTHPEPAHRVSWDLDGRPIPMGKTLRNTCGERACVNPDHWTLTTRSETRKRAWATTKGTAS